MRAFRQVGRRPDTAPPPDNPDTIAILRRAHAGDNDAWLALIFLHSEMLRRLTAITLDPRLRTRIDPDDVVQEALIDAFRKLGTYFEAPLPFSAWLRQRLSDQIGRLHRDHLEARKRDTRREVEASTDWDDRLLDPGTSPSRRAGRADDHQRLHEVLGELAEADREVISLFFFEEYQHGEIGSILGLNPATVRQRLSRAILRVGKLLRRSHPEWCHDFESPGRRRPT